MLYFIAFEADPELRKELLSETDLRGNTPVILCIILHYNKKDPIYKDFLSLLITNGANFKKRDINGWTAMSIAVSYNDEEIVRLLYNFYLRSREKKVENNNNHVAHYLGQMKDLYIELKWKIHIPLLSFLLPNDLIKIWKRGSEVRADFTFHDFKNLHSIRKPSSLMLKYNDRTKHYEILKANHEKKEYYNYMEPLEQDEIDLVIKEIMTKKRMNGSFKLLECRLADSEDGEKQTIEEVNGFKAKKYFLNLRVKLERKPNEVIEYFDLNENNYLNKDVNIVKSRVAFGDKGLKENIEDGYHVKNKYVANGISELEKEKEMKAYVWVIENSPINSQDAVNLIESIGPANQLMDKVKEFFEHPDLQKIIKKNGFPIKITIPYNIFIDLTFSFKQFKEMDPNCQELQQMFTPFESYARHKRKDCQKLFKNYKTRTFYANIK